jgi:hypothetical protein
LEGLSANGIAARTGTSAWTARTITGTTGEITVTDGDGVAANPTIGLPELISASRKFGTATDYTQFEAAGTGTAEGFIKHAGTAKYWVDVDFPIIIRTTGANIPTLTTINGNLTAPAWQVNDFNMCESQEFIHPWEEGSTVYWHIHLTTNGTNTDVRYVRFEVEYGYCTPNGQWVFPAVLNSGDLAIPANTPDKTMMLMPLGSFTPTGVTIGGHCLARLRRVTATGAAPTGDPWVPMLQLHVHCDSEGSRNISSK